MNSIDARGIGECGRGVRFFCRALIVVTVFVTAVVSAQERATVPFCDNGSLHLALAENIHNIADIQSKLKDLGFDPKGVDGKEGKNTRSALGEFCKQLRAEPGNLIEALYTVWLDKQQPAPHLHYFQLNNSDLDRALADNARQSDVLQEAKQFFATQYDENMVLMVDKERLLKDLAAAKPESLRSKEYELLQTAVTEKNKDDQAVKNPDELATTFGALIDANAKEKTILEALQTFPAATYAKKKQFTQALQEHGDYGVHVDSIVNLAGKGVTAENIARLSHPIAWSGGDCGCVPDTGDSETYGFYPFWLAAEARETAVTQTHADAGKDAPRPVTGDAVQLIDFSNLTSIGYFVFSLDENRNVLFQDATRTANAQSFARIANKHRSKVDWIVSADGWAHWKEEDIEEVVKILTGQLPHAPGSGLTVYFPGYESGPILPQLICRLSADPAIQTAHSRLNLMLTSNVLVDLLQGPHACRGSDGKESAMSDLLASEAPQSPVNSVLVFLSEPTRDTKKNLRTRIEEAFHGVQRRQALRRIIPIVSPIGSYVEDSEPRNQFDDDLVYFQDNFGGVGYWPLPTSLHTEFESVKEKTLEVFEHRESEDILDRLAREHIPELCAYACPNRAMFRVVFDVLAGILVLLGIVSIWNCTVKEMLSKRSRWVIGGIAATALIFLVSLICDPFWNEKSTEVVLLLVTGVVLYVSVRQIRKQIRGALP